MMEADYDKKLKESQVTSQGWEKIKWHIYSQQVHRLVMILLFVGMLVLIRKT